MRYRFMAASRATFVTFVVAAAVVLRRARRRIAGVNCDHVLIHMRLMQMVQVPIMEVVRVPLMLDRGVPA